MTSPVFATLPAMPLLAAGVLGGVELFGVGGLVAAVPAAGGDVTGLVFVLVPPAPVVAGLAAAPAVLVLGSPPALEQPTPAPNRQVSTQTRRSNAVFVALSM
jgi:hypothetical protein